MHVVDLLDPLRRRMMWSMRATGYVVEEEFFLRIEVIHLLQILNGIVRHRRRQVPAWLPNVRIDSRGVAKQVGFPLTGVAANEAVEILETHADGPLLERAKLTCLIGGRVVVLAEPGRGVAILFEDLADGGRIARNEAVVAGKSG